MRSKWVTIAAAAIVFVGASGLSIAKSAHRAVAATFNAGTPITAAFYYPWYPETWYADQHYTPSLGLYSSDDEAVEQKHIAEMKYAGIDAGILSWWGQGSKPDSRVSSYLAAGAAQGFPLSVYYELESTGDPSVAQLQNDLTYLHSRYATNPDWLRINANGASRPVIFVYADSNDGCGMADRWKQATAGTDWYYVLKVFSGYQSCVSQPSSWHQYAPASAADSQGSYSFTISPGFWLHGASSPLLTRDPARWAQSVASMKASPAQWHLITTFNEWGEGTSVEPDTSAWRSSSGFGTYLDALHNQLGPNNAGPAPLTSQPASGTRDSGAFAPPLPGQTGPGLGLTDPLHPPALSSQAGANTFAGCG